MFSPGGLHWLSFNGICFRQIIHTKMVNVQYSVLDYVEDQPKQDLSFET